MWQIEISEITNHNGNVIFYNWLNDDGIGW